MTSRKIIARKVSNLTDARYFAAWGVEWMSFDSDIALIDDQINPRIIEMMNWLEGCNYAIELSDNFGNIDAFDQIKKNFKGIVSPVLISELEQMQWISTQNEESKSQIISNVTDIVDNLKQYYLSPNCSPEELREIVVLHPNLGLVFSGSEEEKVGFKSFDELDEFFEILEEESV